MLSGCPQAVTLQEQSSEPLAAQKVNDVIVQPFELSNVDLAASKAELALFERDMNASILARDFEALEKMAAQFRRTKERFIGGGWKIHSFYTTMSAPPDKTNTEAAWQAHINYLRAWKRAKPQSITARCALVGTYINYAWFARGRGYANTVSESAWKSFFERIDIAVAEAKSITNPEDDPYGYFENKLMLATAQDWGREWFEKTFIEATTYDPSYQYFYCETATNLLPRWGGRPGEWEQFAEQAKNHIGGDEGLRIYYFIAAEISYYYGADFFKQNRVAWSDIKRGFLISVKQDGTTVFRLNQFGAMAFAALDSQTICKSFALLTSDDYDSVIWNSKEGFESRRKMAQTMCTIPRIDNMVKDPSPLPPSSPENRR